MRFSFVDAIAPREQAFTPTTSYRPQTKLRKGNVFTSVCQEFCLQGGGVHPPCRHAPPRPNMPPGQKPPPRQTATAADGTHPTGMHCCLTIAILQYLNRNRTKCDPNSFLRSQLRPSKRIATAIVQRISSVNVF